MSGITVGSAWFNRCDGVEAVVVSVGNDCIGFTQTVCGKKCFYSHTVGEFKEYYEPLVQADMVNNPPHYKGESGKPKKYQAFAGVLNERIKQVEQCIADAERKHSHYFKDVSSFDEMDTYLFCRVWKIQDDSGALHHALKKMMDAGKRGSKDKIKDITEARDTLNRYLEIEAMFSE